jgi:hypothetical protein
MGVTVIENVKKSPLTYAIAREVQQEGILE